MSQNKYKINIHAHSIFSDGINSPYHMALKAKELCFTALVITDHYYGDKFPEVSMHKDKMYQYRKCVAEAKKVLPVISGLEVPFLGGEILIFGGTLIKHILDNGLPTEEDIVTARSFKDTAVILCHPSHNYNEQAAFVDGYEHYNSGSDFFQKDRDLGELKGMPGWCNSDAHHSEGLEVGYNIVGSKITTEGDLIKYIKRGSQPTFYIREER